jgi:ABC-type glycerol-3-phosphate transport system permease component
MLAYSECPFALLLTQPIRSQTTVSIASVGVSPNTRLSPTSVTLAMTVPIAFALIVRRYLLRGMLSGALQ